MRFKDLQIGDSFDWINPAAHAQNSFYDYCVKTSARKYENESGQEYTVGTINAEVYHVVPQGE